MQRIQIRDARKGLRRTALAAVLLAGTALGGFAIGHAATRPPSAASPQRSRQRRRRRGQSASAITGADPQLRRPGEASEARGRLHHHQAEQPAGRRSRQQGPHATAVPVQPDDSAR